MELFLYELWGLLPSSTKPIEAVIFINGFLACVIALAFFLMWRNLLWIKNVTAQASTVQVKAGGSHEVVMVSYWLSEESLQKFFRVDLIDR